MLGEFFFIVACDRVMKRIKRVLCVFILSFVCRHIRIGFIESESGKFYVVCLLNKRE